MVVGASAVAGGVYAWAQGDGTLRGYGLGIMHGVVISFVLSSLEIYLATGRLSRWIDDQAFTPSLLVRSAIYAAVFFAVQLAFIKFAPDGGQLERTDFWRAAAFSALIAVAINFALEIANLVGGRTLLNFFTGRYHQPVDETRFVLFVDIVGSTSLAEQLGGLGIHRFLDRTFRLLTASVVDYHGEVLNYVGDELIVTWPERDGAIGGRPLRCFLAMRDELAKAAPQFEREFGAAPHVRGSLHFGPVIIGEIGDIKRAIVFNGDTMNTASRLEQLSRNADGGFLASSAAIEKLGAGPKAMTRDLGRMPIRGRADGIDVFGLAET